MLRIVSAILFYPRGGSAHAARALAAGLRAQGHEVTLLAGSRSDLGADGDARCFYGDVQAVDFGPALRTPHPMRYDGPAGTAPMHPSFEDRPGAADAVFAVLDDLDFERQVRAWSRELDRAGAREADVLHLHHLTPLNEAARRVAPRVPVVGQLHGTELLMLERIARGAPSHWTHADRWSARLRRWAGGCDLLAVAPAATDRAVDALGVSRGRLVELPGGVDLAQFRPLDVDRESFWTRVLGHDGARVAASTVLLYVGRFTAVKRLDRLIEAFAQAQRATRRPCSLVLVGGYPGECEGEHPEELTARLGARDVYLAGWHPQAALPEFFSAADAVVLSSEREQFGQVLIEGMACGLPVIATASLGPSEIVQDGVNGWLVEPSADALGAALAGAVDDPRERDRRGCNGRRLVSDRYSWTSVALRLGELLSRVASDHPAHAAGV